MLGVFEKRFERTERVALGDLSGAQFGGEQPGRFSLARLAMAERQIGCLVWRDGKCDAAQRGLHRVEAGWFRS